MKFKQTILTLSAAAVFFGSSAFAADATKDIVGTWTDTEGVETIEYKADGTLTETLAGGDVMKGKYSFPDATHIKVELEGPMAAMGPIVSAFTLKGDEMDVTEADGATVMHYKRGKAGDAK